jgi:probable rRNA maturation factor
MRVDVIDRQLRTVDEALVRKAAITACQLVNGRLDELSVVLLDDQGMKTLNRQLLARKGTTDVIAFEAEQDPDALRSEIYVNTDAAARQGPQYGHDFVWELCFLVAHGTLHALGYDDHTEASRQHMFSLQEQVVRKLQLADDGDTRAE